MAFTTDYSTIPGLVANSTGMASYQFYAVKLASTAGQAVVSGAAVMNSTACTVTGLLQNAPAAGEAVEFAYAGIAKGIVGQSTAIAIGDAIASNSTGKLVTSAKTDNAEVLGKALEASSASGDIIAVLLVPGGMRY